MKKYMVFILVLGVVTLQCTTLFTEQNKEVQKLYDVVSEYAWVSHQDPFTKDEIPHLSEIKERLVTAIKKCKKIYEDEKKSKHPTGINQNLLQLNIAWPANSEEALFQRAMREVFDKYFLTALKDYNTALETLEKDFQKIVTKPLLEKTSEFQKIKDLYNAIAMYIQETKEYASPFDIQRLVQAKENLVTAIKDCTTLYHDKSTHPVLLYYLQAIDIPDGIYQQEIRFQKSQKAAFDKYFLPALTDLDEALKILEKDCQKIIDTHISETQQAAQTQLWQNVQSKLRKALSQYAWAISGLEKYSVEALLQSEQVLTQAIIDYKNTYEDLKNNNPHLVSYILELDLEGPDNGLHNIYLNILRSMFERFFLPALDDLDTALNSLHEHMQEMRAKVTAAQ